MWGRPKTVEEVVTEPGRRKSYRIDCRGRVSDTQLRATANPRLASLEVRG